MRAGTCGSRLKAPCRSRRPALTSLGLTQASRPQSLPSVEPRAGASPRAARPLAGDAQALSYPGRGSESRGGGRRARRRPSTGGGRRLSPGPPAGLDAGQSLKARSRSSPPTISLEHRMGCQHAGTARARHARLSPLRCRFGASGRWLTGPRGRLSGCRSRVTTAVVATRLGVRESLKRSAFVCDQLDSRLLVPTPLENAVAASRGRPAASGIARRNARA